MSNGIINDQPNRLRDRVRKLGGVKPAVEKIIATAESEIASIMRSPEYQLAERTGNGATSVFNERIAEIREKAMSAMERLGREANEEIDYLGPKIADDAGKGRYATLIGADAAGRGWQRARALLDAGIAIASVIEVAKSDRDDEMLAGLELNAPTYIRASAGARYDEASVQRSIATIRAMIEEATDPLIGDSGASYRAARREFEQLSKEAAAYVDFGHKAAAGRATAGDRIALAWEAGDVPTAPEPRPFNGVRGPADAVLGSLGPENHGIGTTVSE